MESHDQFSTYGYGYGYWNDYGVTSHSEEEASNFEKTTYKVFPPHTIDESGLDNKILFTTRATEEKQQVNNVVEFMELLYSESRHLFNKVYGQLQENHRLKKHNGKEEDARAGSKGFSKVFKKVPSRLYKKWLDGKEVQTMRRSLSLGSPRSPPSSAPGEDYSELKLERFKVKPIDLQGVQGKGKGDQGAAKYQY